MATGVTTRLRVPKTAGAGETVVLKARATHRMESGERLDPQGNRIPRSIIHRFTCAFNGETVVDIALEPAISTNPYFKFDAVVHESGRFEFTWFDDDGSVYRDAKDIVVS